MSNTEKNLMEVFNLFRKITYNISTISNNYVSSNNIQYDLTVKAFRQILIVHSKINYTRLLSLRPIVLMCFKYENLWIN